MHEFLFHAVHQYGYWVIALGSVAEGETVVAFGGFFAHQGLLSLPLVMLIAFIGSFVGDQIVFQIGKRYSPAVLRRWPKLQEPANRAFRLLERYQNLFILGFRFVYGIRTVSALVIGASHVKTLHFMVLNAIAAALWAVSVSAIGFLFGHALTYALGKIQDAEIGLLVLLLIAGLIGLGIRLRRSRRKPAAVDRSV